MKRFPSLVIVLLFLINSVRSQTITITFAGTLNTTPIPLDSILVMNLTAGGDTTIYFPDNVLVLGSTGLQEFATQAPVLRNQPNPFAGATDILVSTRTSGQALLTVHDATGRDVAAYTGSLTAGQHRFRFTAATPGVHLLTVVQDGERATHRLVALAGEANGAGLTYAGSNSVVGTAKSDRSLFTWTPGDELRYIGYATNTSIVHSAAITEVPVATATRTFVLFAGLTCPESPTVTDIDGNVYRNVQIGSQCWMAENLRASSYRDGTTIPNVTGNTAWAQLNSGAWCNYDNSPANDAIYGKLYNWYAASNPNICPQGWHVPTDAEWQQLESALGVPAGELGQTGPLGGAQNVGGKMKTTTLWNAPNTGATNESGFSGLPGGIRFFSDGAFSSLGYSGYWWSASESDAENAWFRNLTYDLVWIYRNKNLKWNGFCLRCVRD
ncbi:MAG: T9SS type A sorting domain-containing protein [Flavobacteriales bacterium]|nr:T9SS type A sorting domain-containing protein [Flavobacteriales bacterium]